MPGLNGRQLAECISALRPDIKVLYMSGYTADLIAQRGVLESSVALLEKPFTQDMLLRKIRLILDRTQLVDSAVVGG